MLQAIYNMDADDWHNLGGPSSSAQIDHSVYAYEGVVIPGGQLLLGRWWRVDEDDVLRSLSDLENGMKGNGRTANIGMNIPNFDRDEYLCDIDPEWDTRPDNSNLYSGPFMFWRQAPES